MTMTDPIADMLARLRNANQAYHERVAMPYSKIKANIAEVLKAEGYVATWTVEEPAEEHTELIGRRPSFGRDAPVVAQRTVVVQP